MWCPSVIFRLPPHGSYLIRRMEATGHGAFPIAPRLFGTLAGPFSIYSKIDHVHYRI
jgi:hypothetical protein